MAFTKLDHKKLNKMMVDSGIRPKDLALLLGISRQLTTYILYKGGRKYAVEIAKVFGCKESDLLYNAVPLLKVSKGFKMIGNRVRKDG